MCRFDWSGIESDRFPIWKKIIVAAEKICDTRIFSASFFSGSNILLEKSKIYSILLKEKFFITKTEERDLMQKIIENAKKGKREAFVECYEKYWKETKFVCFGLLLDEDAANHAVSAAFKQTWEHLLDGSIQTESEFREKLFGKAAAYCISKTGRKGQNKLPLPVGKNFLITERDVKISENHAVESILRSLPLAGRYVFVLHQIAGFQQKEIARMTGLNEKMAGLALEAEPKNVACVLSAISQESGDYSRQAPDLLDEEMIRGVQEAVLPQPQKDQILESITPYVAPLEKKRKQKMAACFGGALLAVVLGVAIWFMAGSKPKEPAEVATTETQGDCYAEIAIKDYGTITVALDQEAAPLTVDNFISLAESGFYDGLTFHRIMEGFMMQGGDPEGTGLGGSDQTIVGEFANNGHENPLQHTRGAISMARSNDYDSASSQFFIVHQDSSFLDGEYAAFGYVTEGMDVVDEVCTKAEPVDDNGTIPADQQPVIEYIKIHNGQ